MVGAIIYIRVSTKEQTENLSLPTQLRVREEYCRREGFEILERFKEEGENSKTTDRRELQRMLEYCRSSKGKVHFLVVFNLTRFARDKYDHFALRSHLKSLGISLRSATEPIDDTSPGKLMEGVLAAFAQFDNDVRSDRTRAGMKEARARAMRQRPIRNELPSFADSSSSTQPRRTRSRTFCGKRPSECDQSPTPATQLASDRSDARHSDRRGDLGQPISPTSGDVGQIRRLIRI